MQQNEKLNLPGSNSSVEVDRLTDEEERKLLELLNCNKRFTHRVVGVVRAGMMRHAFLVRIAFRGIEPGPEIAKMFVVLGQSKVASTTSTHRINALERTVHNAMFRVIYYPEFECTCFRCCHVASRCD